MADPKIAQKGPYIIHCEPGRYCWCSCGLSQKQPYCDGSHKQEGQFKPIWVEIDQPKKVVFCGCKHTKTPPFCDGSHKHLT